MENELKLLMRDGPVSMRFDPSLTPAQYDELLHIVRQDTGKATVADLRKDVKAAAERWGVVVTFTLPVRLTRPGSAE